MNKFDLHIHSKYSADGEYSIEEIIKKSINNKVDLISVTDHNCIKGTEEAINLCKKSNIDFIPGIELDCNYKGIDLHLLGYNIDWKSNDFISLEENIRKQVMDSFPDMIKNLEKVGIYADIDEVLEKSEGKLPTGELIAEVLLGNKKNHSNNKLKPYIKEGVRGDMPYINFYHDFFAQGKPAYVKINWQDYDNALDLVINNGGTPIIAHPGLNLKDKEEIVIELLDKGAKGLEVFNNYHNEKQIEYFADLAIERNAIITCGSDFHGKNKPLIDIGNYRFNEKYRKYLIDLLPFKCC
ncbi:MAG: PHP domain-containing protein [bacterium]|nr:PHP domain-containing protein [bacterium]